MEGRSLFDRKDENVVVEELSSLTIPIPEDQMVTVQEEVITTAGDTHKSVTIEEVMEEGQAPDREPEQIAAIEKRRKLTLKPKPMKLEMRREKRVKREKIKEKKEKKIRKKREPKKPKMTAYSLFSDENRATVAEENPDLQESGLVAKLASMWAQLPETDKDYWRNKEEEENLKAGLKKAKKRKGIAVPPPDSMPEALDLAAHMKLLGDSFAKMGEIASESGETGEMSELTVSRLMTDMLDCLLCATAPLLYLTSHVEQLEVIPEENQIKMLNNIASIMPGLENFK